MAIIKCKMCGGDLILEEGSNVCECEYCGSRQTVPSADNEKKLNLFARANRLRANNEFDKAAGVYESIVADFPEEAEAYWGLILCKYGIEYVDDPATGKKIPTCHRSSFDSVMDDPNFELVMEYADAIARRVYRDEAKQLEELRKGIIEVSSKEEPYDIFICYKETAEDGQRTLDSVLAQDVYDMLTESGYRVFFSRVTLEDKLGVEYEPYIFAALNSAKIMLAFGTDYDYYNAVWVKNEWSRFLQLIAKGEKKTLIPCYKNLDAYDLPKEFAKLQAQDMGKVGAMQDLLRGVKKILPKEQPKQAAPTAVQPQSSSGPTVANLLRRGSIFLEEKNWTSAEEYFNKVLDIEAENGNAYLGLALVNAQCANLGMFASKLSDQFAGESSGTLIACETETERIEKLTQEFVVPGYLPAEKIRNAFAFDLTYASREAAAVENKNKTQMALNADRNYSRARKFADTALKAQLDEAEKQINSSCDERINQAKTDAETAKADVQKRYQRHLDEQEQALRKKSLACQEHREADYQAACEKQKRADGEQEFCDAEQEFRSLGTYKDAEARAAELRAKADALKTERERKQEEAENRAKREAARRAKRRKTIAVIVGVAALLAIATVFIIMKVIIPSSSYSSAEQLLSEGKYDEAAAAFDALGDYSDSADRALQCRYDKAAELQQQGCYEEAIMEYAVLGSYKDSVEQITNCEIAIQDPKYNAAVDLYNAGKYDEAITAFKALNGYKDSAAQITKCENAIQDQKYNTAVDLYNAGKYDEAITAFKALNGYKDSVAQISNCKYDAAADLYNAGKYDEAITAFKALNGYKDSIAQITKCENAILVAKLKAAVVGDIVYFGSYEQDNNKSNGKEDIEWIVLAKEGNKALLISKYALDCQRYNTSYRSVRWETCSLRKWLNDTFISTAFSSEEQKSIISSIVIEDELPAYITSPRNNTPERVFLLSEREANKYFSSDGARQCQGTAFCYAQGAYKASNGNCKWWLRSNGFDYDRDYSSIVNSSGSTDDYVYAVTNGDGAVRPALWINLGS